ncbi:cardiolipin synthase [Pedobacter sp. CAN_A7]|uniref:cardiolipin synthase n=1 Tax=Pedobacter sp. CAN_A7 TaxID=2787722 RepID=UPI0018CB18DD
MNWIIVVEVFYVLAVLGGCLRIINDTPNTSKTLSYLLLALFLPVVGMIIYFSIGTNYRKRKLYTKKLIKDEKLLEELTKRIIHTSELVMAQQKEEVGNFMKLAKLLLNGSLSKLSAHNQVELLLNGEEKFPEVIKAMQAATHHIHLEYYIYEDDVIGNQIKNVLIEKARAGVEVRFIYDDFGSRSIRKTVVLELIEAGVHCVPFYKVIFLALANRINYRNHRKIIIIDGYIAFTGGINVSDKYINHKDNPQQQFWRDTHIKLTGEAVSYLQYLFINDWNFCSEEEFLPDQVYFSIPAPGEEVGAVVQVASSGPDSDNPTILYALLDAIGLAEEEILITTPYFIPGESLTHELIVAALSGIKVKILVPDRSDSMVVDAAARSYYGQLVKAGVEIYLYKDGFIHAKTLVSDSQLAIVGTANMDHRSFDLNFEVNTIVYDRDFATQLRDVFYADVAHAVMIDPLTWYARPFHKQFFEKVARLLSHLL